MRRWLASLLADSATRENVALIATELAGNAIRHTASGQGGAFAVEVTRHEAIIRVAVADGGAAGEPALIDEPGADSGRGLQVVRGLAIDTGVRGDRQGRLVWADVLDSCSIPAPPSRQRQPAMPPPSAQVSERSGNCSTRASSSQFSSPRANL